MQLEEFMANPPPYAILSHTWEDGEVTFQDCTNSNRTVASAKKGFTKIQHTCQQAKQTGIAYAWVDTCCIDKTSSAELTEVINSMFAWYAASDVCYVFLSDLGPVDTIDPLEPMPKFAACRWFTRGWTLQELIAPKVVEFYDKEWTLRGTKCSLVRALEAITGIDGQVLRDSTVLADIPVARRMSWAANRKTTRVEDTAYCLLGIFDVSMPMLYGEGGKAFIRLQEEIAREANDLTLFAWQARAQKSSSSGDISVQKYRGILATSPAEFLNAGTIVAGDDKRFTKEFLMTNKGLRINSWLGSGPDGSHVLNLNCSLSKDPTQQIGIYLTMHGAGLYARNQPDKLALQRQWQPGQVDPIYISKRLTPSQSASLDNAHCSAFFFRSGLTDPRYSIKNITQPKDLWDSQQRLFLRHGMGSFTGLLHFTFSEVRSHDNTVHGPFLLVCGITAEEEQGGPRPWVAIGNYEVHPELAVAWAGNEANLGKLGEVGSGCKNKSIIVKDASKEKRFIISVEIEEAVVDSVPMYCIDLKFEDLLFGST
ncbi:HET-domain-containing protein [Hyaloscypha variabilis F]|uniref:HET-domain-containing protein n=1 Tax=Hyaloscypha variabilis (strain UAMH 11265 / GT02V1 / F) TaxID=1149755 RepID=A0A2J6R2G4_HYAVF|nr:HET-domain-containing protein [Hyaloscypha variabilis F]